MLTDTVLAQALTHALAQVSLPPLPAQIRHTSGKVRESLVEDQRRLLITTDRVSAFDHILGVVPFKGQVLNQLSAWWFEQVADLVAHHMLAVPDPNMMLVREATALPVEVIVRGYITGVTSTALWTRYAQGEREPYGIPLPDGLQKNDPLPTPIITPTTKAAQGYHDERLTRTELLERGLVAPGLWAQVEQVALALFARGQERARAAGLILVDTKYEFGLLDGQLALIDEIHTPDSSRYWLAASYARDPHAPEHYDKEYLRLWYAAHGYRGDGIPPAMPPDVSVQVAQRYIFVYEQLTGQTFVPAPVPASERIAAAVGSLYNHIAPRLS